MLIKGFRKRGAKKVDDLDKLRDMAFKWLVIIVIAFTAILVLFKLISRLL